MVITKQQLESKNAANVNISAKPAQPLPTVLPVIQQNFENLMEPTLANVWTAISIMEISFAKLAIIDVSPVHPLLSVIPVTQPPEMIVI